MRHCEDDPINGNGDNSFPYHTGGDPSAFPMANSLVSVCGGAPKSVTTNAAGTSFQQQGARYLMDFDGTTIEFENQSAGGMYWIKVNDEYIDPLGVTLAPDATTRYIKVTFAAKTKARIEWVAYGLLVGSVRVDPTASVAPAPIRGPRAIIFGDSFNGTPGNYTRVIADALGWDDVWPSGIGGTGIIGTNGGAAQNFEQRYAHDVLAYTPKVSWGVGSINDADDAAGVAAAVLRMRTAYFAAVPAGLFVWSMNASGGPGRRTLAQNRNRRAIKAALAGLSSTYFVDVLEMPLQTYSTAPSATLAAAAAIGDTTISVYGTNSVGGYPAPGSQLLIDEEYVEVTAGAFGGTGTGGAYKFTITLAGKLQQAHASGATWTVVGGSYISGVGAAITFTATVSAATSATLSQNWAGPTDTYNIQFSDGTVKAVTLTNGSTSVSWTGAVTATASAIAYLGSVPGSAVAYCGPDWIHPTFAGQVALGAALANGLQRAAYPA